METASNSIRLRITRAFYGAALLPTILAGALCVNPLANLLGYEFSLAIGLLGAMTSVVIGLDVGRRVASVKRALSYAWGLAVAHLAPPLLLISLNALRVRNCDYFEGLAFYAMIPLLGSVYGASLGLLVGRALPRHHAARRLIAVLVILGHLASTLWRLYFEPPIFAYDHLWGHFAGSLYDEVIRIDAAMVAWRIGTVLRIAAIAGVLTVWVWAKSPKRRVVIVALLATLLFGYDAILGARFGYRLSHRELEHALPMRIERPGLVLHFSAQTPRDQALAITADHAFRLATLTARLDVHPTQPITSYVYESAATKGRLIGARHTVITKPWLRELHLHAPQPADPILAHELVHVVAAELATGPLAISARFELLPNVGLTEGLAEALSPPRGDLDLDAAAHSMRVLRLAPDVRDLFASLGFWRAAPSRAYVLAGSFVAYLMRTYGVIPVKAAYRDGDLDSALGASLDDLATQWEHYVDALPTDERELRITMERFRTPSIFARTCAHEIAALRESAARASPSAAARIYQRISDELGRPASAELAVTRARLLAGDEAAFRKQAEVLLGGQDLTDAERISVQTELGMLDWARGDLSSARLAFAAGLKAARSLDEERLQWVRLWALDQPASYAQAIRKLIAGTLDPLAASVAFTTAALAHRTDPTYGYLVGRQLHRVDDCPGARAMLLRAGPHPFAPIEAERQRLLAECAYRLGDLHQAAMAYHRYAQSAPLSGERARAQDWLDRIAWRRASRE